MTTLSVCIQSAHHIAAGPGRQAEYLVKWLGKAHVHNEWTSRDLLLRIAKRKLMNFERRTGCAAERSIGHALRTPKFVCTVAHKRVPTDMLSWRSADAGVTQ